MDALDLLRNVSETYRSVKSLDVDALSVVESGDENSNSRAQQRIRFAYAAPDRMRYEPRGKNQMLQVSDGVQLHTVFPRHPGITDLPRVASALISEVKPLPFSWRSEFPLTNDAVFLFQDIDDRVNQARILRQEDGCYVVGVTYLPSPYDWIVTNGLELLFWIDANTFLVMKRYGELGHRHPTEEEIHWSRLTLSVQNIRVNEPIADELFHFVPPVDADSQTPPRCGISVGGGGGLIEHGRDQNCRMEHRSSHQWDGDALVEHSKWQTRGHTFHFERRMSFSADGSELAVDEKINGQLKGSFRVPLNDKSDS